LRTVKAFAVGAGLVLVVLIGSASVDTPADVIHPNIHDTVGDGSNANPIGVSPAGGNEIHGIGNVPGQDGDNPNDDGVNGFANQLTDVHGGIDSVNPNAG
jgi:hypothetical protein